mgnify:CR=1 FL=1
MSRIGLAIRRRGAMTAIALAFFLVMSTPSFAAGLAGSEWQPTVIGDMAIPKDADVFVQFQAEGELRGHGGCNGFFGSYRISGDSLEIGPLGATHMACPDPIMDRESAFMKALQAAKSYKRDRIALELFDESGAVVMKLSQRDAD